MKVLITGSEGFVGKNLVEQLSQKGYPLLHPSYRELDLTNDEQVKTYLSSHEIKIIVHTATTLRNGTSYPEKTCENNLRMFFNLQKYLKPSVKLINLGSGSEYDRRFWHRKMPEEFFDRHIPRDEHSYSKYLISKYIEDLNKDNILNLRIFGIYGRYEDYRYKFVSNAIVKNLLKQPIVINQNVVYDYIYISDFVRIVEFFLERQTKQKTFNATTTETIDLVTIAKLINEVSDYKSEVQVLNSGIGVEYSGDNTRLMSEMGSFTFTPHKDAIEELYKYYRNIVHSIDAKAVLKDDYLDYAKKLRSDFFRKDDEKFRS